MSAARATSPAFDRSPTLNHAPILTDVHPAPTDLHSTPAAARRRSLQDRAWELACQGLRGPAIASTLGVPERTVRAWLQQIRREVAVDLRDQHADELLLAVASIRQVAATAWGAYEREVAAEVTALTAPTRERHASHAPRYLSLALAAHVQTARLLGLHRKDVQDAYDALLTAAATNGDLADDDRADDQPAEPRDEPEPRQSAESAESADTPVAKMLQSGRIGRNGTRGTRGTLAAAVSTVSTVVPPTVFRPKPQKRQNRQKPHARHARERHARMPLAAAIRVSPQPPGRS